MLIRPTVSNIVQLQHTKCITARNCEPHETERVDVKTWRFQFAATFQCTDQCIEVIKAEHRLKCSNDIDKVHDGLSHPSVFWEGQVVEIWSHVSGIDVGMCFYPQV